MVMPCRHLEKQGGVSHVYSDHWLPLGWMDVDFEFQGLEAARLHSAWGPMFVFQVDLNDEY